MKISNIRTHHVRCELEKPFGFSQWYYDQRNVLIIEVETDTGLVGWGECYGPAEVIQAAVTSSYAPLLIGDDPIASEVIWHKMWRATLDFARHGVMMAAMSGLDMALWDLKGKALGLSVSDLMGGRHRDKVPCYATGMYYSDIPEEDLLPALVTEAKGYADQGFTAMKIKVGKNINFDEKLIVAMRKALPDIKLMADSNHAYDLPEAVRIGKILEANDYRWFEEPLSPEQLGQYRQLHDKLTVPLAAGECEQTRYGFQKLLDADAVHVLQPDLAYCGGPSEALKIRALASAKGINVVPHVWGTMLNLAAATHFLATAYHEPGRKESSDLFLEYDRTPNPLRDELYQVPVHINAGIVTVPTAPGLGVTIDQSALKAFTVKGTEVS